MLLLFLVGLGIGIHEHITYQDQWQYNYDDYQALVLDLEQREKNPLGQTICIMKNNMQSSKYCPGKDDPRWNTPWYFGEN